jgi:hypothetical protein
MPGPTPLATADVDRRVDAARDHAAGIAAGSPASGERTAQAWVPVGPGRSASSPSHRSGPLISDTRGYSIQIAKVRPPTLREATLERPRLLDWLHAKIHGRVVLVIADAGYGKSTLLADFSRRTRLRTLWFRLDENDRD